MKVPHECSTDRSRQPGSGDEQTKKLAQKTPPATVESGAAIMKSARRRERTAEERHQMIAEAAYYRALRRGFHGGSDLEDWLDSEAEIDQLIQ